MRHQVVTAESPVGMSPEEKREIVERVLKSHTFSRCDQLKRFLQYICEKEISGDAQHLNEYSIAVEALGRPVHYSPSEDSSVRTRAHALRQKLQEYYQQEEPEAEVRIHVPKGGYNPQFVRETAITVPLSLVTTAPPAFELGKGGASKSWSQPPFWKPFATGVFAAILPIAVVVWAVMTLRSDAAPRANWIDPIVREVWGRMLQPGTEVEVCIATPPAMLLHSYKDGQIPPTGPRLLSAPKEVASWYEGLQMVDGGGRLYMHNTQDVFLFGDSLAATSAVQLLSRSGSLPQVIPESNLRAFTLRGRNVVLIGSPNYSPLAARFLMSAPLSVHYDPIRREEVVSDDHPETGKLVFRPLQNELGMLTKAYGLVTVLPSQVQGSGGPKTFIFSGITSAGPQAALEFLRSSDGLKVLKQKLREQGYTEFPPAFQVVVSCGLDHNLALNWEYETHVVIQGSPHPS